MMAVKKNKKINKLSSSKNKKRRIRLAKKEGAMLVIAFFILILVFINFFENKGVIQAAPFITKTGLSSDLKKTDELEAKVIIPKSTIAKQEYSKQIPGEKMSEQAGGVGIEEVEDATDEEERMLDVDVEEGSQVLNSEQINGHTWFSFGDTFSSNAYLDMDRTDMYIDYQTTALTFTPQYNFSLNPCEASCRNGHAFKELSDFSYSMHAKTSQPKGLPQELKDKEITFKAVYQLEQKKVAAFIVLENNQENLYIYFYNSGSYEAILNNNSGFNISTKYSRFGGKLDIAGSDDDFLILYSGYEIMAFHYSQRKLEDISHFLGLRVAGGGFVPKIIKQGQEKNSVWYILGVSDTRSRLIKLWQNGGSSIAGSIDLSFALEHELRKNNLSINGFSLGNSYGELLFLVSKNNQDMLLSFSDNGFDNSASFQAVSQNINNKDFNIFKAVINEAVLSGGAFSASVDTCKLYLGDNLNSMKEVEVGQELSFSGESSSLYWWIMCSPYESKYFSPWVNHVNDIKYQVDAK